MRITVLCISLVISGFLFAGNIQADPEPAPNVPELRQKEADLLAGQSVAVAYSGFRQGQHPDRGDGAVNPSDEEILEDLIILSETGGFRLIRLYDSGENSEAVLRIIRDHHIDIRVMLGIWLDAELSNHEGCPWLTGAISSEILEQNKMKNARQVAQGIRLARTYPGIVAAVNVGNEALVSWTDHLVSVDSVVSYVRQVKQAIGQPVTVAENYVWWAENGKSLSGILDFISVHTYPVWEGKDIDGGLTYTLENLKMVRDALPEARMVVSEAGWATVASEFGNRASEENQAKYVREITQWAAGHHVTVFLFEAFDEDWKGDPGNPLGAEKHWGLFKLNRQPKKVMAGWMPAGE
ncbi:glycosyl hydrolase [bacterium]|nr:glycosyl hydrolase [bacterium]